MKKQYLKVCFTFLDHLFPPFIWNSWSMLQFDFDEEMQFQPCIENLMALLVSKLVIVKQEMLFFQLCPKTGLEKSICWILDSAYSLVRTKEYAELKIQQIIFPAHTLSFLACELFTKCCENVVSAATVTLSCFLSLNMKKLKMQLLLLLILNLQSLSFPHSSILEAFW